MKLKKVLVMFLSVCLLTGLFSAVVLAADEGTWKYQGGNWYYVDASGNNLTGWQVSHGKNYYLDPQTGAMHTDWLFVDGDWYYLDHNNGDMKTGWVYSGGKWYYMNADGTMTTGWVTVNGKQYYMDEKNGDMHTGWLKHDNGYYSNWYYFDPVNGDKKTGWLYNGGKWYYLDPDRNGMMATGYLIVGSEKYILDVNNGDMKANTWVKYYDSWVYAGQSGALLTGWQKIRGTWYYFDKDYLPRMAHNEWRDGYWLNKDGAWTYPYYGSWRQAIDGRWWFGDTSGWYAKSERIRINGLYYQFDAFGYWLENLPQ